VGSARNDTQNPLMLIIVVPVLLFNGRGTDGPSQIDKLASAHARRAPGEGAAKSALEIGRLESRGTIATARLTS